jgi:transcription elongation factor Elf1
MYVGRRHSATVTTKQILPFTCPSCRHEALAIAVGVGQGDGQSPFMLDEDGAKDRAASRAARSARDNARLTLSLAACPRCKKRDERAVSAVKRKAIAGALACLIGAPLFGVLLDQLMNTSFGVLIMAPIGALCAWFAWSSQKWKWETAEKRVAFLSTEDMETLAGDDVEIAKHLVRMRRSSDRPVAA